MCSIRELGAGLAKFIERPAGEVAVAFALLGTGSVMFLLKIPKAEDVIVAGFTLVGRAMMGGAGK